MSISAAVCPRSVAATSEPASCSGAAPDAGAAFVSVIGSAATAGLTGATVMLTLTLSTLGLPLEGVGLLMAIDPILDMMRTATNVAGQVVTPLIVASREKILDRDAYNSASPSPVDEPQALVAAA